MKTPDNEWRRLANAALQAPETARGGDCLMARAGSTLTLLFAFCIITCPAVSYGQGRSEPAGEPSTLLEAARPRVEVPGAPVESEVTMRSLLPRLGDTNTLEAIKEFHVSWLEWTYLNGDGPLARNGGFIEKVHDMGVTFGAAASAGNYEGEQPREDWNIRNLEGELVYATWMRPWDEPNPWGCANNPEFREGHLRYFKRIVDAGADLFQRDEPFQNKYAFRWGGCFCDHCMEGFNEWLGTHADFEVLERLGAADLDVFCYREYLQDRGAPVGDDFYQWSGDELKDYFERFQIDATLDFHRWWRQELNEHAGRYVPVSCNNGMHRWGEVEQLFDYWIGELHHSRAYPEYLFYAMKRAREHGKTQTATMPLYHTDEVSSEWIRHIRQTMGTMYALGGHMEMPWDTYIRAHPRFFGDPQDYADLSAFVHAVAPYLDGYTDAAVTGGDIEDERWNANKKPVRLMDEEDVYAFTRVRPDDPDSPVAIHLVDWRDEPVDLELSVLPRTFFGDGDLKFRLLTPVPYERESHLEAFETGEYGGMVEERPIESCPENRLTVPALSPWGILVVESAGE